MALGVEFTGVFDETGMTKATSSPFTNFQISDDPEDQSYEFNQLLEGVDYVIQEAQADEVSGVFRQYIGVAMRDADGIPTGFVQIAVQPEQLENAVKGMDIASILDGVKVGTDGFAFAVDPEEETFVWYPQERLIGRSALEEGLTEDQMSDGYCGYVTIGRTKYYGAALETDEALVFVVVPLAELSENRLAVSLASAGVSLICLAFICLLLGFNMEKRKKKKKTAAGAAEAEEDENDQMVDVVMPDGSIRKTETAQSRWDNIGVSWSNQTPEQRILSVLKGLLAVLAAVICLAVLLKDRIFDSDSVVLYVLNGSWERGINVFALTASIMGICVISVGTMVIREILHLIARISDAHGETICRLLGSFMRYFSVIMMFYQCFALFGADSKTVLASAGILTLVIGLGAKELVSDILAGLFIIFEGEFRVGDIVTIGDWRGTVQEIGVRTTKVMDGNHNIKIISNSSVSGVINMTKQYSVASCDFGIEYGESLERVEAILKKELPLIGERIPAVHETPGYSGVVSLGDSSVVLRVTAKCAESDRGGVANSLNREIKLMCDRYGISMPYPQIVVNPPATFPEQEKANQTDKINKTDETDKTEEKL